MAAEGLTFHCRPSRHSQLGRAMAGRAAIGDEIREREAFCDERLSPLAKQASVGSAQQSESKQSRPWPEHGGGGGGLGGEGGGGGERLGGGGGGDGGVEGDGGGGGGESHS